MSLFDTYLTQGVFPLVLIFIGLLDRSFNFNFGIDIDTILLPVLMTGRRTVNS